VTGEKLLTKSANILLGNGFEQVASAVDRTGETDGITHTVFRKDGHEFHVRAKEYTYKGRASFGVEQIDHALKERAWLVFYSDTDETFTVFDPEYVDEEGTENVGLSKVSETRRWVELPIDSRSPIQHQRILCCGYFLFQIPIIDGQ